MDAREKRSRLSDMKVSVDRAYQLLDEGDEAKLLEQMRTLDFQVFFLLRQLSREASGYVPVSQGEER